MFKHILLVSVSLLALVPSVAHADKDFADGRGGSHDCDSDGNVNILHDGGTYVLTGECKQINVEASNVRVMVADVELLSINGNGNVVKATAIDSININGNKNSVRWKSAKIGRRPTVLANGSGNSVARAK